MKAAINSPTSIKKRSWLKIFLWFVGLFVALPTLLFCLWYIWLWGNFDFGEEKFSFATECGDYRLNYYRKDNGVGHVDYAHKSGKVYGKFPLERITETSPLWDDDCKGVTLGANDKEVKHFKATE